MKRIASLLAASLVACMLAFGVGCSSGSSASSEASSAASATPDAVASASAEAPEASQSAASAEAAAGLDPMNLADGEYQVDVALEGGTGRAYIESPARVVVDEGQATLVVVWSSENYDLMIVDGEEYLPVPRPGNSTFEIPAPNVSDDLPIQAETTAMSEPHTIDYVIHFDASTLASAA